MPPIEFLATARAFPVAAARRMIMLEIFVFLVMLAIIRLTLRHTYAVSAEVMAMVRRSS